MPGTLWVIWFVSPWPMKPAPTIPTRIGRPSCSRAFRALSTMIILSSACVVRFEAGRRSRAHLARELRFDLVEQRPGRVLRRHLGDRQRPRQAQAGIVVAQAAFRARCVELADLVAGLR